MRAKNNQNDEEAPRIIRGEKNVSLKLQKEEPANKLVWQAVQVTGKNNTVTETKNLV